MPTYDYKCTTCGKDFEYQQKMSESPLEKCPIELCQNEHKGEGDVVRVFSKNVGLVFKGSGFYLTDYTNKSKSDPVASTSNTSCACSNGSCQTKASA